jgi:hypothetical protein
LEEVRPIFPQTLGLCLLGRLEQWKVEAMAAKQIEYGVCACTPYGRIAEELAVV